MWLDLIRGADYLQSSSRLFSFQASLTYFAFALASVSPPPSFIFISHFPFLQPPLPAPVFFFMFILSVSFPAPQVDFHHQPLPITPAPHSKCSLLISSSSSDLTIFHSEAWAHCPDPEVESLRIWKRAAVGFYLEMLCWIGGSIAGLEPNICQALCWRKTRSTSPISGTKSKPDQASQGRGFPGWGSGPRPTSSSRFCCSNLQHEVNAFILCFLFVFSLSSLPSSPPCPLLSPPSPSTQCP